MGKKRIDIIIASSLVSITFLSALLITGPKASADNSIVDEIRVTVPVSCSMSSAGEDSHMSEISNGVYKDNIGTTNFTIMCNDSSGFSVYATGYTGNVVGEESSNKLIGLQTNLAIDTGILTGPGSGSDVSNWAMRITAVSDSGDITSGNNLTIDSDAEGSFSNYHKVPKVYTKVAHKNASTDMSNNAGATISTTYAAYISRAQTADSYKGGVKYTLVHPSTIVEPSSDLIEVVFYGSGLYFDNNGTEPTNTMTFRRICVDDEYDCHYTLNSGQYKTPINANSNGEWFYAPASQLSLSPLNDGIEGVIKMLEPIGAASLNGPLKIFYKNPNVVFGAFMDDDTLVASPNLLNIVAYRYNGSTFENVGGTYHQPSFFNNAWYAYFYDANGYLNMSNAITISPIQNESQFIYALNQSVGQIDIPGGSVIALATGDMFDPDAVVYIYYEENANGDYVSNMPESPEEHSYDWMDGMYYLSCTEPERDYYTFLGWEHDGIVYSDCNSYITDGAGPGESIYVYATWEYVGGDTVYINYGDPSGEGYNMPPDPTECQANDYCTIDSAEPQRGEWDDGTNRCTYSFSGWYDNGSGITFSREEEILMGDSDLYLEAIWDETCEPIEPEPEPDPEPEP